MIFNTDILKIDPVEETRKVAEFVKYQVESVYRRGGIVVGLSGGIDSAVIAEISVRAVGRDNVVGLILPEKESNPISSRYASSHAEVLDIEFREIDISSTIDSIFPYERRDEFIKQLIPDYAPGCKYNITLPPDLLERDSFSIYVLQVQLRDGNIKKKRLSFDAFRAITSFANIKIRSRMLHLYAEAEKRGLLVVGTTNRTEFVLGDFCKYGDGGTDIEPIAHLYKNQIYQLADYLGVIPEIIERSPSPDTFSLPVTDQEFFFRVPFDKLDLLLYAWENNLTVSETAQMLNLPEEAVKRVFTDFTAKNRATAHLRELPHFMET